MSKALNIHVVTTAYNQAKTLEAMVVGGAADNVTWHIFQHSKQRDVALVLDGLERRPAKDVFVYRYGVNRGLSRSWNEGLLRAYDDLIADMVIICNDDIALVGDELQVLAKFASKQPKHVYAVDAYGYDERTDTRRGLGFSCLALRKVALQKVGMFDQNYFPIYGEDIDFDYRAQLLGLRKVTCEKTEIWHAGSASVWQNSDIHQQNHATFVANRRYHGRKWGGVYNQERYTVPFNDDWYGLYISPEDKDAPYGETYDRTDFEELVRI